MQNYPIPESAFVGQGQNGSSLLASVPNPPPGIGPQSGDQSHPLSIPAPPIKESAPTGEHGPSTNNSMYNYPYPYKG